MNINHAKQLIRLIMHINFLLTFHLWQRSGRTCATLPSILCSCSFCSTWPMASMAPSPGTTRTWSPGPSTRGLRTRTAFASTTSDASKTSTSGRLRSWRPHCASPHITMATRPTIWPVFWTISVRDCSAMPHWDRWAILYNFEVIQLLLVIQKWGLLKINLKKLKQIIK